MACAAFGCSNAYNKHPFFTIFRFPKDKERYGIIVGNAMQFRNSIAMTVVLTTEGCIIGSVRGNERYYVVCVYIGLLMQTTMAT